MKTDKIQVWKEQMAVSIKSKMSVLERLNKYKVLQNLFSNYVGARQW